MRKSRFTESQIVGILKQGETGIPVAEILRQHNISKATYFHWRAKYAGASVDELSPARGARSWKSDNEPHSNRLCRRVPTRVCRGESADRKLAMTS